MSGWPTGGSRPWRRVRAAVLLANWEQHGGICRVGVRGVCTGFQQTVHHVLGRAVTGDDPAYLVASCKPCNMHVGDPQTHDPDCPKCQHITNRPRPADPEPKPMTRW